MAERTLRLEMEQDALHGAEADILCNFWKRLLSSEATAAAFPSAAKTLACASSSLPATEENRDTPSSVSSGHKLLRKELAPVFLRMGKNWGVE